MVASLNAFMHIEGAKGESRQGNSGGGDGNYQGWIELQQWEWEVTAETNWTKGGGASVGKPSPGTMSWEHYWDRASATLLGYICTGSAFSTVKLEMCKTVGSAGLKAYFKAEMNDVFITKVNQSAADDGNVVQKVEMVFKNIVINYLQQGADPRNPGALSHATTFEWDIPGGSASPGAPLG